MEATTQELLAEIGEQHMVNKKLSAMLKAAATKVVEAEKKLALQQAAKAAMECGSSE